MNHTKKLKVYSKFKKRTFDVVVHPEISLSGKWVENAGFEIGAQVFVKVEKGKMTITRKEGQA